MRREHFATQPQGVGRLTFPLCRRTHGFKTFEAKEVSCQVCRAMLPKIAASLDAFGRAVSFAGYGVCAAPDRTGAHGCHQPRGHEEPWHISTDGVTYFDRDGWIIRHTAPEVACAHPIHRWPGC